MTVEQLVMLHFYLTIYEYTHSDTEMGIARTRIEDFKQHVINEAMEL